MNASVVVVDRYQVFCTVMIEINVCVILDRYQVC